MASTAVRTPQPPPGHAFTKPNGRQIITQYLAPKALHGGRGTFFPGHVAEGVGVFSASPEALPFHPSCNRTRTNGDVWGYFFAARPAGDARPVPGGCWVRYGLDKGYGHGGDPQAAVAFRRRFAFHVTWLRGDGRGVASVPTPWLMKEYRLNKGAAAFRAGPWASASMDCVVCKVFRTPVVHPPPPTPSVSDDDEEVLPDSGCPSEDEEEADDYYSSDEDQERKRVGCSIEGRARKRARFGCD